MPSQPPTEAHLGDLMLTLVPGDGSTIGNTALRRAMETTLRAAGLTLTKEQYWQAHTTLITRGVLLKGQGRGGSVRRAQTTDKVAATQNFYFRPSRHPQPQANQPLPSLFRHSPPGQKQPSEQTGLLQTTLRSYPTGTPISA